MLNRNIDIIWSLVILTGLVIFAVIQLKDSLFCSAVLFLFAASFAYSLYKTFFGSKT